jgi:chromosome segregation ATPase
MRGQPIFASLLTNLIFIIYRLREDLQAQSSELSNLQTRLKDVQILYSEAQSKELPLQFELSKASRDRDFLSKQVSQLETEIQRVISSERSKVADSQDKIHALEMKAATLEGDLQAKGKELGYLKVQCPQ